MPGVACGVLCRGTAHLQPDSVLVLCPDEIKLVTARPSGILMVGGAPLSHPMIRLLGLGVPTVVISQEQSVKLVDGARVVVDGTNGVVSIADKGRALGSMPIPEAPRPGQPVMTANGEAVELRVSVADVEGAADAVRFGATSIGLVRSEALVPDDNRQPETDFFEHAFVSICAAAHPLPVTVRLLDICTDKRPLWLPALPGMEGPLGLRGSRLYDIEPVRSVFLAQVRAIGRVAPQFDLSLLIPYMVRVEEFMHRRAEIEGELPVPMAVGTMAETPAAAFEMADWLQLADLVGIGCNDLMQCLFAADRDVPEVGHLLDPYAPVLFRFLRQVAGLAGDDVGQIQLCGYLPQAPGVMPLLLGLGYRAFSVEPALVPYLAEVVRRTDTDFAESLAIGVCAAQNGLSVRALLGLPALPD